MATIPPDRMRLFLARWLLSPLLGARFRGWMSALADNGLAVPPAFWARAKLTTLASLLNSFQARLEWARHGAAISATHVRGPLFVLGHYRSGTTHLHNLLAQDPRLAFPNNYQANQPWSFLLTEWFGARLGAALVMRRRPHDNVPLDLNSPTEDELALCAMTFLSPHMGWHFPARADFYNERYLTFEQATAAERSLWVESLRLFARKLTYKYGGRRLVLKSPLHTARLPLILEAFPDAQFVHIHRNPYEVFRSTRHMERHVEPLFRYQQSRWQDLDRRILHRYRALYAAYLRDRQSVPKGALTEIAYDELVADPIATLERVYGALDLRGFDCARERMQGYLDSIGNYRSNDHPEIEPAMRRRVAREWSLCFDACGYPK